MVRCAADTAVINSAMRHASNPRRYLHSCQFTRNSNRSRQRTKIVWCLNGVLLLFLFFQAGVSWAKNAQVDLVIRGVGDELENNVLAMLSLAEYARRAKTLNVPGAPGMSLTLPGLTERAEKSLDRQQLERLVRRAPDEIREALKPFGYYGPQVKTAIESEKDGVFRVKLHIIPGPPVIIHQVKIELSGPGRDNAALKKVVASAGFKQGERLIQPDYENFKNRLQQEALRLGFLDNRFTENRIELDPLQRRAAILINFDTGPQYFFGEITIKQDILWPKFLDRYITIRPGEPFSSEKLLNFQLSLSQSGYFDQVTVQPERDQAVDYRVPIVIDTQPSKPQKYSIGLGYGTDTGPRTTLSAEFRRLNKRGHKLRLDAQASRIKQTLSAQYQIPLKQATSDFLAFTASVKREEVGDVPINQYLLGASRNEAWHGFQRRLYLNIQHETYDLGEGSESAILLYPGISLTRTRADARPFARKGYSVHADLHGGTDKLISDTDFIRTELNAAWVQPLTQQTRFLARGGLGVLSAHQFNKMPPSQRFYAGGARSVRGYRYESISPRNAAEKNIGGKYLGFASLEADWLMAGDFGAAVFFDTGDAVSKLSEFSARRSVGVGFRWRTPVGMVRIDLAHPLNYTGRNWRIEISIGPDL